MKKTTLFLLALITSYFAYADGGWLGSAVNVSKDGGSQYKYQLNGGYTDGSWGSNTLFDGYDFGTPTSLILNGAAGNAWVSGGDYYDATSFVMYYRVYKNGDTPGTWTSVNLSYFALQNGSNFIYDTEIANIDVLALATVSGTNTYTLEVTMSKNQLWSSGNWNSMIPGGQGTAYDAANSGYKAIFTKTNLPSSVDKIQTTLKISGTNGKISARFEGEAKVQLYSATGQLIRSTNVLNEFSENVKSGVYIIRINDVSHKVIVK